MGEVAVEGSSLNEKKPTDKEGKPVKKNPTNMLTRFFKPMDPEEKQKILLNELAKVQQEIKAK
jgi:hypothetical protein